MLMSLLSGSCEALEKLHARVALHDSGFDMALGYVAYCRRRDVDWPWSTLSYFLNDFSMGNVSDRRYIVCLRIVAMMFIPKPIGDRILPSCPVVCVRRSSSSTDHSST